MDKKSNCPSKGWGAPPEYQRTSLRLLLGFFAASALSLTFVYFLEGDFFLFVVFFPAQSQITVWIIIFLNSSPLLIGQLTFLVYLFEVCTLIFPWFFWCQTKSTDCNKLTFSVLTQDFPWDNCSLFTWSTDFHITLIKIQINTLKIIIPPHINVHNQ